MAQASVVATGALQRLGAFARLGKVQVWQHWYGIPVVWSLLPAQQAASPRVIAMLALMLVSIISVMAATAAFDDVSGWRDGTDEANYRLSNPVRSIRRKPLLTGELTESEALVFGRLAMVAGLGAGVAPYLLGAVWSPWVLVVFVVAVMAASQYSAGLRLSYVGGGELLLVMATAVTVVLPYASITGSMSWRVVLEGLLLGLFLLQVSAFSNTADATHDRMARRWTFAARLSSRANRLFIAATFAAAWAVVLIGALLRALPVLLPLLLIPCWAINIVQLREGVLHGRLLAARALGFRAFDAGCAGLIAANLLVGLH
jgi:1,4-dihydroxy-2-naphthoate octaprenyltransferase